VIVASGLRRSCDKLVARRGRPARGLGGGARLRVLRGEPPARQHGERDRERDRQRGGRQHGHLGARRQLMRAARRAVERHLLAAGERGQRGLEVIARRRQVALEERQDVARIAGRLALARAVAGQRDVLGRRAVDLADLVGQIQSPAVDLGQRGAELARRAVEPVERPGLAGQQVTAAGRDQLLGPQLQALDRGQVGDQIARHVLERRAGDPQCDRGHRRRDQRDQQ
jgi:hypothetical protein